MTDEQAERRRMARKDAQRLRIADVAFELIERDGVDALTMPRLAREVGCAVGALYLSFPSKSALLLALQEQAVEWLSDAFGDAVARSREESGHRANAGEAALAHLGAGLRVVISLPTLSPARHRLIDELLSSHETFLTDEDLAAGDRVIDGLLHQAKTLLAEAQQAGALSRGDVDERARVLWAALHGLDHFRKRDRAGGEVLRTPRLIRAMLETLIRGWGGNESAVKRLFSQMD